MKNIYLYIAKIANADNKTIVISMNAHNPIIDHWLNNRIAFSAFLSNFI
ncbi:MAG TPA: hypothetical protein VN698_02430 [Bacteroidia bacterium]|nr:hypothetical protein [Bacteroidia bacterium]